MGKNNTESPANQTYSPRVSEEITTQPEEKKCPSCKTGRMKNLNFRTGSTNNPGTQMKVCEKCGHRIEIEDWIDIGPEIHMPIK